MATRAQKLRLGAFLTAAIALLLVTLFYLVGRQVFTDRPEYLIRVGDSVHGLDRGSPVKFRGVRVGVVERIRIDPDNVELVDIYILVDPGTPIKVDHKAVLNMQGITGLKFVELIGGTREAKRLEPGGEIEAGQNILDQLTGDAADISRQVVQLLNQLLAITGPDNQERLDLLLDNANTLIVDLDRTVQKGNGTLDTAQRVLDENRRPVRSMIGNLERSSAHLDKTLAGLDAAVDSARTALEDAKIPQTTAGLRETGEAVKTTVEGLQLQPAIDALIATAASVRRVLDQSEATLAQNQDAIRSTLENLERASRSLKETSRTFQEKPVIQVFGDEPPERKLP